MLDAKGDPPHRDGLRGRGGSSPGANPDQRPEECVGVLFPLILLRCSNRSSNDDLSIRRISSHGFWAQAKPRRRLPRANPQMPHIDLDHFIATREGRTPQQIIDEDGEARFRQLETSALRDVLLDDSVYVVALGGGAWTVEQNRALINEHDGFTVWLDAPFQLCWQRIRAAAPLARSPATGKRHAASTRSGVPFMRWQRCMFERRKKEARMTRQQKLWTPYCMEQLMCSKTIVDE